MKWLNAEQYVELFKEADVNTYGEEDLPWAEGYLDWMANGKDWRNGEVDTDWQDYALVKGGELIGAKLLQDNRDALHDKLIIEHFNTVSIGYKEKTQRKNFKNIMKGFQDKTNYFPSKKLLNEVKSIGEINKKGVED